MAQSTFEFVRDNIAATPFHQWLLPELLEVNEKKSSVTIRLPIRPEFCRLPGRPELHGAIVAAMVDITGHAAIAAKVLHAVATVDMRVDYLRPGRGKYFVAAGRVVRLGGRIAVAHMELVNDTVSSVGGVSLPATRDCPACCRRLLRRHSGSQVAACPFPLEVPRRSRLSLLRR